MAETHYTPFSTNSQIITNFSIVSQLNSDNDNKTKLNLISAIGYLFLGG